MRVFGHSCVMLASLVTLLACGGGDSSPTQPDKPEQEIASIEVSPDSARLDSLSHPQEFSAEVTDTNGDPVTTTEVQWSVGDTTVAGIGSDGQVTGRDEGTTAAIASAAELQDSAELVVNDADPTASISSPGTDDAFSDEEAVTLRGSGRDPEDGTLTGESLIWSSSVDDQIGTGESASATGLSPGDYEIELSATDSEDQTATASVPIVLLDQENLVEALHLGSGKLRPSSHACSWEDRWVSFPRGTELTVQISTALSDAQEDAVRDAVSRVEPLSGGEITTRIVTTDSVVPKADTNEVAIGAPENPSQHGCEEKQDDGCTVHEWRSAGVLLSSRSLVVPDQTPQAHAHDAIGHGVFGLCHVDGNQIGTPANSLMSGGQDVFSGDIAGTLTNLDSAAVRTVYESELSPGDQREAFEDAGLIKP